MAMFNARALDHLNDKEYVRLRGFLTLQLYGSYDQYKRITNGAFSDEFTSHFEKRIPQIEATLKAAQTNLVNFNLSDLKSAIQNEIAK